MPPLPRGTERRLGRQRRAGTGPGPLPARASQGAKRALRPAGRSRLPRCEAASQRTRPGRGIRWPPRGDASMRPRLSRAAPRARRPAAATRRKGSVPRQPSAGLRRIPVRCSLWARGHSRVGVYSREAASARRAVGNATLCATRHRKTITRFPAPDAASRRWSDKGSSFEKVQL